MAALLATTQDGERTVPWGVPACLSDVVTSNICTPQGTVLLPLLLTIYTSDFYNSWTCHRQKFSDDSSIVGCFKDSTEEEYREGGVEIEHLMLNIKKIKALFL